MRTTPLSFGKTVKVYAPRHEAVRIANSINGDPEYTVQTQQKLKSVFDDTSKGHALVFSYTDPADVCYIFSGDESREFLRNLLLHTNKVKNIKMNYPFNEAIEKVLDENKEFLKQISDLIKRTQEPEIIKLYPEETKIDFIS